MLTIKNLRFAFPLAVFFITSCSKHASSPGHPSPPPLTINSFSPTHGPIATIVTIRGASFGTIQTGDSVFFNGHPANLVSVNDSIIQVVVPGLAGAGNVVVKSGGNKATGGIFTYDTSYRTSQVIDGLSGPFYLAIDTASNLYVSQYGTTQILKIDTSGVAAPFLNLRATGLAIDIHNNLFIAGFPSGSTPEIDKINLAPGGTLTTVGYDAGSFLWQIAVDTFDNVYGANLSNNTVDLMSPSGQLSHIATGLFNPSAIAVGPDGTVYTTNYTVNAYDNYKGAVTKISPSGVTSTYATMNYDGQAGMYLDGANDIYVTVENQQYSIGWIERIDQAGDTTRLISSNLYFPCGIVRDKKANFYVTQQIDGPGISYGSVLKLTPY